MNAITAHIFGMRNPPVFTGERGVRPAHKKIRHEFKYILTPHQARLIEEYIERRHLSTDEYAKNGEYFITSLYFDTPGLRDYHEKLAGLNRRHKLRARIYGRDLTNPKL